MSNFVQEHLNDSAKSVTDIASIGVTLGTLLQYLPAVAALFSIVWTGIRIFEWCKGKYKGND